MLRGENGITLVALIITVIVLIILAAVTIVSFRESNLINTAVEGTTNYANAQKYEVNLMDDIYNLVSNTMSNIQSIQSTPVTPAP